MCNQIYYDDKRIELIYSNKYTDVIKSSNKIKGVGSDSNGDCQVAEEIALSYLAREAILKKPYSDLERIIVLNRDIFSGETVNEIKIVIIGFPVFKKKNKS